MRARTRPKPRTISSRRLYLALAAVFLFVSIVEFAIRQVPLAEAQVEVGENEKAQMDSFKDNNSLFTTLATAVIGATAGLLFRRESKQPLDRAEQGRVLASIGLAALSIYFGHVAGGQVLYMLHHRFFNMYYGGIWIARQLQFWLFLASVVLLADAAYRLMQKEEGSV